MSTPQRTNTTNRQAPQKHKFEFWEWVRDKVIPSLTVALCIGVFATYIQIVRLVDSEETTKAELVLLKADVANMKETYVKRMELLEVVKRVEQQLEIVLLKATVQAEGKHK